MGDVHFSTAVFNWSLIGNLGANLTTKNAAVEACCTQFNTYCTSACIEPVCLLSSSVADRMYRRCTTPSLQRSKVFIDAFSASPPLVPKRTPKRTHSFISSSILHFPFFSLHSSHTIHRLPVRDRICSVSTTHFGNCRTHLKHTRRKTGQQHSGAQWVSAVYVYSFPVRVITCSVSSFRSTALPCNRSRNSRSSSSTSNDLIEELLQSHHHHHHHQQEQHIGLSAILSFPFLPLPFTTKAHTAALLYTEWW